jgi:hypothetical protein
MRFNNSGRLSLLKSVEGKQLNFITPDSKGHTSPFHFRFFSRFWPVRPIVDNQSNRDAAGAKWLAQRTRRKNANSVTGTSTKIAPFLGQKGQKIFGLAS